METSVLAIRMVIISSWMFQLSGPMNETNFDKSDSPSGGCGISKWRKEYLAAERRFDQQGNLPSRFRDGSDNRVGFAHAQTRLHGVHVSRESPQSDDNSRVGGSCADLLVEFPRVKYGQGRQGRNADSFILR